MGIIELELGSVTLSDGTEYVFEYNEGEIIHIHIDSMRIDMSESEFLQLNRAVQSAHEKLKNDKGL